MRCLVATRVANRSTWASGEGLVGQAGALAVAVHIEIVYLVVVCSTRRRCVRPAVLVLVWGGAGAGSRGRLVLCGRNLGRYICPSEVVADNLARSCELRLEK